MAGFEVITYGRFWVIAEALARFAVVGYFGGGPPCRLPPVLSKGFLQPTSSSWRRLGEEDDTEWNHSLPNNSFAAATRRSG